MTSLIRRAPLQSWAALLLVGGAMTGAYVVVDTLRARRGAVPLFDPSVVAKTEVYKRYPAEVLKGFDVVVKNYYVPVEKAPPTVSATCALHARSAQSGNGSGANTRSRDWTQFWRDSFSVFSNEYTLGRRSDRAGSPLPADQDVLATRIVVGDAHAPGEVSPAASSTSSAPPVLASATWPLGMVKYSAMVLAPHRDGGNNTSADAPVDRGLLRELADSATHQSLVRCNPLSTDVHGNCDGDPAYLGAPYLRVMLSAFLLLPSHVPSLRVAVLGVGGGSLPNFLQHYFSRVIAKLDLVDVEPACFRAAVEDMGMKETLNNRRTHDALVRMHPMDATEYLVKQLPGSAYEAQQTASATCIAPESLSTHTHGTASAPEPDRQVDLLFVDLFVGSEQPDDVTSRPFIDLCHATLSSYGVAAFNLPARNPLFVASCRSAFGAGNVFTVPVPASSNTVVLARKAGGPLFSTGAPPMSPRHFWRRAQQLTDTYQLPYDLANHYPAWWRFW